MRVCIALCGVAVCLLCSSAPSAAAILATYPMTPGSTTNSTATTPASANSLDTDLNTSASIFVAASGLVGSSGSDNFSGTSTQGSDSIFARIAATAASPAGAIAGNDYFTFTLTPNSGYGLNLSSLTFQTAITRASSAANFDGSIFVRSSVDGFTADLFTLSATSASSVNFANRSIDLTSPTYQGLLAPVEFRFYVYDNSDSTADNASVIRLDTVVLNGETVAIPEPSMYLLGALGLAGWMVCRRRAAQEAYTRAAAYSAPAIFAEFLSCARSGVTQSCPRTEITLRSALIGDA